MREREKRESRFRMEIKEVVDFLTFHGPWLLLMAFD